MAILLRACLHLWFLPIITSREVFIQHHHFQRGFYPTSSLLERFLSTIITPREVLSTIITSREVLSMINPIPLVLILERITTLLSFPLSSSFLSSLDKVCSLSPERLSCHLFFHCYPEQISKFEVPVYYLRCQCITSTLTLIIATCSTGPVLTLTVSTR